MAKITYTDKVALNINQDVADINKCNASDLNEIKNVVNNNDDNFNILNTNVGDITQLQTTNKNSIVNAINEVNTNDTTKGTYSTNETVVGTWIDNKPIYRKVLQVGALNGTNIKKVNTPENIYFMLPYQGMLIDSNGNEFPINYNNIYNLNEDIGSFYYKQENCINIKQLSEFGIVDGYIIIEYTKTTD